MHENKLDYTNTFLDLSKPVLPNKNFYAFEKFRDWHTRWRERVGKEENGPESSFALMRSVNPAVIPRNHRVEEALQAAEEGELAPFHQMLLALQNPYQDGDQLTPYQSPPEPTEKIYQTFCGT